MTGIEKVGTEAFSGERLDRPGIWAVAFLADWCPFCEQFAPAFASLRVRTVRLLVADLTDVDSPLWDRFRIEVVPTVVVFRDGVATARYDGRAGEGIDPDQLHRLEESLGAGERSAPRRATERLRSTDGEP